MIFSHENAFEAAVCKVSAILPKLQPVNEFSFNILTVDVYHVYIDS